MTREELKEKEDLLYKYNKAYYEDNTSLVSDKTYDEQQNNMTIKED